MTKKSLLIGALLVGCAFASILNADGRLNLQTESSEQFSLSSIKDKIKGLTSSAKSIIKSVLGTDDPDQICQNVLSQYKYKTTFDNVNLPENACNSGADFGTPFWQLAKYSSFKDCVAARVDAYQAMAACYQ